MPGRLVRQTRVVAEAAGLERSRLLAWTAWAGLSAAFSFEDGASAGCALRIAELAAAQFGVKPCFLGIPLLAAHFGHARAA